MQEHLNNIVTLINNNTINKIDFLNTFVDLAKNINTIDYINVINTIVDKSLIKICFSIILNVKIDINILNHILRYNYIGTDKILITIDIIECVVKNVKYDPNFYEYINKGFCPNIETLYNIIPSIEDNIPIYEHPELVYIIKDIIEIWNVVPDKKVLDKLMLLQNIDLIKLVTSYKVEPDITTFKLLINNNDILIASDCYPYLKYDKYISNFGQIIELILIYIPLTFDMLIDIFPIYQIKDLERFNIKYDDKLYGLCHYYQIFPEHYMSKFSNKEQISFRHSFYNGKIEMMLTNFNPDQYCYNNAILNKNYELLNNYEYYGTGFEAKVTLYSILGTPIIYTKEVCGVLKLDILENIIKKETKHKYRLCFGTNISYKSISLEHIKVVDIDIFYNNMMSSITHIIPYYEYPINYKKYNKLINYKNKIKKYLN